MNATAEGTDGAVRIGDRLRPKRSRTGRIWRVRGESRTGESVSFRLEPDGGASGVWRTVEELAEWERVP